MKQTSIFALAILLLVASCGGQGASKPQSTDSVQNVRLTPQTLDPTKPVDGGLLLASYKAWYGKKVLIVGFPNTFFEEDKLGTSFSLRAKLEGDRKDKASKQALISLVAGDDASYSSQKPLIVEGTLKSIFDGALEIVDASIVPNTENKIAVIPADPAKIGTGVAFELQSLYDEVIGWIGKKVQIKGNYWGVTKSSNEAATSWRIDIVDASGNKTIGLQFATDPGEPAKKEGIIATGTILGESFDAIQLGEVTIQ